MERRERLARLLYEAAGALAAGVEALGVGAVDTGVAPAVVADASLAAGVDDPADSVAALDAGRVPVPVDRLSVL